MYKIDRRDFGVHLVFSGHPRREEIEQWLAESKLILAGFEDSFGVFVDMRDLILLPPESQPTMKEGQRLYRAAGMARSVVILSNDIVAMQFMRIAKQTGIYEWERYVDASTEPNWEQVALDWIIDAEDPDRESDELEESEAPSSCSATGQ